MDLVRHARFFVTIAEERHFGRAAARLGISQPPLSQGLRRFEAHLGVRLFDRDARAVVPTAAGEALLDPARALLEAAGTLEAAALDHERPGRVVRIGLAGPLPPPVAAALASAVRRPDARARVEIVTGTTVGLTERVVTGRLDLAVVRHPGVVAAVDTGPVIRLPTRLLVPADRVPGDGNVAAGVRWAMLRGLAFAAPPRSSHPAAHDTMIDALARLGLAPRVLVVDDDRAALAAVAGGHAFTVTADPALRGAGVAVRVPAGDPLPLRFRPVWSRGAPPGDEVRSAVVEVLREAAR